MRDETRTKVEAVNKMIKEKGVSAKDAMKEHNISAFTYYSNRKKLKAKTPRTYKKKSKMQIAEISPISMQSEKTLFILTSDQSLIQTMLNNFRG